MRDQARVHLAVAVDLDDDLHRRRRSRPVARHDGAADALVRRVLDHAHARVAQLARTKRAGTLRAFVVDHVDAAHFRADAAITPRMWRVTR
jgi:hypothetical protein